MSRLPPKKCGQMFHRCILFCEYFWVFVFALAHLFPNPKLSGCYHCLLLGQGRLGGTIGCGQSLLWYSKALPFTNPYIAISLIYGPQFSQVTQTSACFYLHRAIITIIKLLNTKERGGGLFCFLFWFANTGFCFLQSSQEWISWEWRGSTEIFSALGTTMERQWEC